MIPDTFPAEAGTPVRAPRRPSAVECRAGPEAADPGVVGTAGAASTVAPAGTR
ncbi:hypothetical protein [Natronomonas sp.]|uniref:hypothetical protein n=1 Tax=Natronomonas sp. TaxID=2184060 RepID=UPI0026247287|nr:hypothetical protein [Natronomonas sp.]